ncbi:KdE2, related [Cryptosporidium felis]|nr:KdE2, related [Cryptosporidium felis]
MQSNLDHSRRPPSSSGVSIYYDDRISRLAQRLSGIHNGLEMDRSSKHFEKLAEVEGSMKRLEEEMNNRHEEGLRKVNELKSLLLGMKSQGQENYLAPNTGAEGQGVPNISSNDAFQVERRLNELLQSEIISRKTMEQRLVEVIDDRMEKLKSEILKKDLEREELDSCVKRFVQVDIVRLGNAIKNEIEKCQAIESNLILQLREEIERLNRVINEEVTARQQSIDTLLDLMENLVQQITVDSRNDRSERQNSEDTLLRLLEETLSRIQSVTSTITKS